MSFAPAILFYKDVDNNDDYIHFDSVMVEELSSQATISKYPVQSGFEVSNHMIRHNRKFTMQVNIPEVVVAGLDTEGFQTGSIVGGLIGQESIGGVVGGVLKDPKGFVDSNLQGMLDVAKPTINAIASAYNAADTWFSKETPVDTTTKYLPKSTRIGSILEVLSSIQENGLLCSVNSVRGILSDLAIIDISHTTDANTLTLASVSITFEEVIVVDSLGTRTTRVALSDVSESAVKKATLKVNVDFNKEVKDITDLFA